jgi:hypothetical protein
VHHLVVEDDDAINKGRKLVRTESRSTSRDAESARSEPRHEPPPTEQLDTDAVPDLN